MQENQLLFPEHNEDSVHQFRKLRENKQPSPETSHMIILQKTEK